MEDARAESETAQEPLDIIEAELDGCPVLLVEDNETNQLVVSMQLSTLGYTAMHHRLMLKYRDTSPANINSMDRAVQEADLASVVSVAHKHKSSTRTIGAVQLADLIQLMEDAGKLNESDEVTKLASLTREEFDRVIHYINQLP